MRTNGGTARVSGLMGFVIAVSLALGPSVAAEADRLIQLDGSVKTGQVTRIQGDQNAGGRVQLNGAADQALDLFALRRIERTVTSTQPPRAVLVHLVGGGQVFATMVTLHDGRFKIDGVTAGSLDLPMELVRAVHFLANATEQTTKLTGHDNFARACDSSDAREDQLFVITPELIQSVPGVWEGLADNRLSFRWDKQVRSVDQAKVLGVVLAAPAETPDHAGQCLARLADGSAIWGRLTRLDAGQLVLTPAKGVTATVPWNAVVRLDVRSDRVAFCSDLEPTRVAEQQSLTGRWTWRRDTSVGGSPLKIGEATFERGLGVHADCTLDFATAGRFDLFVAMIGIDAETGGKGDCVFRVLGDGQELFQQRVKGTDKPVEVRIRIAGMKTVSLVVEQGEDWDLGDHADWCDARFVRSQ
jgi:hypothetical protein